MYVNKYCILVTVKSIFFIKFLLLVLFALFCFVSYPLVRQDKNVND